jgi:hypothetical protein
MTVLQKAVCACKDCSEQDNVVAVRESRFAFFGKWGFFSWIFNFIVVLVFPGIWIGAIIGWNFNAIFYPKYKCNQCGAELETKNFRN